MTPGPTHLAVATEGAPAVSVVEEGLTGLAQPAGARLSEVAELVRVVRELHHDLRQPLAAINALVAAAEAQDGLPPVVEACLAQIGEEARQLLRLCREVLDEAASGEGAGADTTPRRRHPSWEARRAPPISIGGLANSVARSCAASTGCHIEVDAEPVLAPANEVDVRRAVWNLLDNAARAAGPDGRIVLGVRREAGWIRISVDDSGPGFGAAPSGAARIGLVVVQRVARRAGGAVEIGTSRLGGARVSIVLPAPVIDLGSSPEATGAPAAATLGEEGRWPSGS